MNTADDERSGRPKKINFRRFLSDNEIIFPTLISPPCTYPGPLRAPEKKRRGKRKNKSLNYDGRKRRCRHNISQSRSNIRLNNANRKIMNRILRELL
ncbi:hypothetical protein GWI33_003795 [Rhynchophorus ferrugineus]|uniref:Uncharacterized protein n=1 Tax=Rhynchophorus ferrugineus TaxID=354439 RepID=A0A834HN48_RHYFE|nr:hypothetical protein GWI33_003795 [Rhynchophorus ferrugineus]